MPERGHSPVDEDGVAYDDHGAGGLQPKWSFLEQRVVRGGTPDYGRPAKNERGSALHGADGQPLYEPHGSPEPYLATAPRPQRDAVDDAVVAAAPAAGAIIYAIAAAAIAGILAATRWWWRGFRSGLAGDYAARRISASTVAYAVPAASLVTYALAGLLPQTPDGARYLIPGILLIVTIYVASLGLAGLAGAAIRSSIETHVLAEGFWRVSLATIALAFFVWSGLNPQQPYGGGTYAFGWGWLVSIVGGVVWGLAGRPGRTAALSLERVRSTFGTTR